MYRTAMSPCGVITIDVEPDDVWSNHRSSRLENVSHLPRFQTLCDEFGMRPTYLVTHSVVTDTMASAVMEGLLSTGRCEIGAHPHLWETPPLSPIDQPGGAVGGQYPATALEEKIGVLSELLRRRFGKITSHRAGRWGFDDRQAVILDRLGYTVDSSVTPGLDWSSTGAPDFTRAAVAPYVLTPTLLEVPCTIKPGIRLAGLEKTRLGQAALSRLGLSPRWLRCHPQAPSDAYLRLSEWAILTLPCLNLMTHSSELCPGTSPIWRTGEAVSKHFKYLREIFEYWSASGIRPCTLREFGIEWMERKSQNLPASC